MTPREIVLKLCERCSGYLTLGLIQECVAEAVSAERERCAKIAETETELPGRIPDEVLNHFEEMGHEEAHRLTVRITKESIARRIRNDQGQE